VKIEQPWQKKLDELMGDPCVSFWLKDALRSSLDRDPLDAYYDSDILQSILKARMEALLG
jgi:hypothetical protein